MWGSVTITRTRPRVTTRSSSVDRSGGIGRRRGPTESKKKKAEVFTVTLAAHVAAMSLSSGTGSSVASSATSASRSARNRRRRARRRQGRQQGSASSEPSTDFSSTMFLDERLSELANMGLVRDHDGSEARRMLAACHDDKELAARMLARRAEVSEVSNSEPLVEMEILVDGNPLATRTAAAECCRAHMCGGDDHLWNYALIRAGDENKPFSVRVRNRTPLQLAVELTVDNETMARNWGVGPHKTKERLGQNTRYFACHTFQFDQSRFVNINGDPAEPAEEDDVLATIDEEDEGAEREEPEEAVDDARAEESAAVTTVVTNRLTTAQFDASFVHDVDESNGGQETAKQMNTPGLSQLQDTEYFTRFKNALPGVLRTRRPVLLVPAVSFVLATNTATATLTFALMQCGWCQALMCGRDVTSPNGRTFGMALALRVNLEQAAAMMLRLHLQLCLLGLPLASPSRHATARSFRLRRQAPVAGS